MNTAVIPMSEDVAKIKDATKDECIAELRRIAEAEPEKVITRNYFRVNGRLAESAWNRHFGTFNEFKRQADITLSRHAHRIELAVAKHASAEKFRGLSADKEGWAGKFLRPDSKRFQSVLMAFDIHDKDCDPFWRHCFLETAKRVQPEKVIFGGDLFDLPEFSKYTQDPRTWDVIGRIKWVHEFLRDLREVVPAAELVVVEGNHEFRLLRHLAEQTPALRAVLADLHGFTIPKLLGLDEFEVNYLSRTDLSAWTERDIKKEISKNYWIGYDCLMVHHFPEGRNMGLPGANGHHHKHVCWPSYSPTFGPFEWHQVGCGHVRDADYCAGEIWSNGFLIANVDTQSKRVTFDNIHVADHAVIGGQWYLR